jgi:hypothetical protein
VFNDAGSGILDENGVCYIYLDPVFLETVNTRLSDYLIFLTNYKDANAEVLDIFSNYFVVSGTPGKKFNWLVRAERIGFERLRWNDADIYI